MKLQAYTYLAFISCLLVACSDYYSENDFYSVKKYDAHMHIRTSHDAIPDQAEADRFLMMNVSVAHSDSSLRAQEEFTLNQLAAHPNRIRYITSFSMEEWDSADWEEHTINRLKASFERGALGIKIWKNVGMVEKDSTGNFIMIDDPRFDRVIQFVIDQNKTVLGHLGEPRNCWLPLEQMTVNNDREYFKTHPEFHMYLHPESPSYEEQIDARDRFLARHPDMRFVGAHLGSVEYDVDTLAKRLDRFPNMAVDMSERICHLQFQSNTNREKVRNFMIKYQDRLIYGSDLGMRPTNDHLEARARLHKRWKQDWNYFATDNEMMVDEVDGKFKGLKLPKVVMDKIYYTNAITWFNVKD